MVGQIVLCAIVIAAIALLLKIVYDSQKKHRWFMNLKPGDEVSVWIYSEYCECARNAVVTKPSDGKYIEAQIIDIEKCKNCSEFNSKNKEGKETCWYNVSKFAKKDVGLKN